MGLKITGPIDEFTVAASAATPAQLLGKYQAILLCVKSQHTADALPSLLPHLADDGFVVSVQNGLNELLIREVVGHRAHLGRLH